MRSKSLDGIKKRIIEVNSIIKDLDPAIKLSEFEMLKSYINTSTIEIKHAGTGGNGEGGTNLGDAQDIREFYSNHQPDKPSDRAQILTAWIYKNRGSEPFTLKEVEVLFDEVGEGRPNRLDMTFKAAQRKGKKLFQSAGRGKFRPNVHGENYFKELFKGKVKSEN